MKKLIIIDPGHGGLIEGDYTTPGKREEKFLGATKEPYKINEGVLNRAVASMLSFQLDHRYIRNMILYPDADDITLGSRIAKVNKLHTQYRCFLLSIHHNWHRNELAHGAEVFTSIGETPSDEYAEIFCNIFQECFPHRTLRELRATKKSKERNFAILSKTKCPALLTEFGFMSNEREFRYISSMHGITEQVKWLLSSCLTIYEEL